MISANVLLREMGMDKLTGYILLTLYVGAIGVKARVKQVLKHGTTLQKSCATGILAPTQNPKNDGNVL